jgi:glycosyltransferase involved in cell wall biosynthesis
MIQDPNTSPVWRLGSVQGTAQLTLYLAPSLWFGKWISHGLPFHDLSHHRPMVVWGSGVNTDYFCPSEALKVHTYFIYFKSQNWSDLRSVHEYLFSNYFRLHGTVLMYYFYTHEELKAAATGSEFCIYLDAAETQGLASLEIMACGCPLFVLDCSEYKGEKYVTTEATSVTCWSPQCGMKSSMARIAEDFPVFLGKLGAGDYSPREFVEREYSWGSSARKLRRMLEALP